MPYRCYVSVVSVLLLVLTLMTACSPEKKEKSRALPPAPVLTTTARQQDVPLEIRTFGTMEASESVTIKPMVSGELTKVGFHEGEDVEKGALLFEMDARPYRAALDKALAAQTRNRTIMDNARRDYERYQQLVSEGLVSQEQAEGYRTRAESATADEAADQAAVAGARTQLSYCTIRAPLGGRLGALAVDQGNVVKANETALVTINALTPIRATFTIAEQNLSLLQERLAAGGMSVVAEVPGKEGLTEQGAVVFVDNAVDSATGTIRLKGEFANPDKRLWPGQFVTLALVLDVRRQAVVLPVQAVQTGQKGPFVFVVTAEGTAEVRAVTTGPAHGEIVVVEAGVKPGEEVVIDGHMRVVPGGKVDIKTAGKTGAADGQSTPEAVSVPAPSKAVPGQ